MTDINQSLTIQDLHTKISGVVEHNYKKEKGSDFSVDLEVSSGITYCCARLPREYLESYKDDEQFVKECYLKILDRVVDLPALEELSSKLSASEISRDEVIENLINSQELANANRKVNLV